MARQKRELSSSGYYHVMYRGNNKEFIFTENRMKLIFLELLKTTTQEEKIDIASYCIMSNHVHLIVKAELDTLSKFSMKLNRKYAIRYNLSNNRTGHAFQERFKSEPVNNDTYLLQAVRYVHNNPINAGLASSASDYKWSSYNDYIDGKSSVISNDQMLFVLSMFSNLTKFKDFHKTTDGDLFLDTVEDKDKAVEKKVQSLTTNFLKTKGIVDYRQLINRQELLGELIDLVHNETNLSQRELSKYLGVSDKTIRSLSSYYK